MGQAVPSDGLHTYARGVGRFLPLMAFLDGESGQIVVLTWIALLLHQLSDSLLPSYKPQCHQRCEPQQLYSYLSSLFPFLCPRPVFYPMVRSITAIGGFSLTIMNLVMVARLACAVAPEVRLPRDV